MLGHLGMGLDQVVGLGRVGLQVEEKRPLGEEGVAAVVRHVAALVFPCLVAHRHQDGTIVIEEAVVGAGISSSSFRQIANPATSFE